MLTPKVKFKLGAEEHELWVEKGKNRNVVMMASKNPAPIKVKIQEGEMKNNGEENNKCKGIESEKDDQKVVQQNEVLADTIQAVTAGVGGADTAKVLKEWLVDAPDLIEETRKWYKEKPEWWGIDPDNTLVFYRTTGQVEEIRALKGESGGHHPHGLALGGPVGQDLTKTGETRTEKNPTHSEVTGLQRRVIREIKKKMGILKNKT